MKFFKIRVISFLLFYFAYSFCFSNSDKRNVMLDISCIMCYCASFHRLDCHPSISRTIILPLAGLSSFLWLGCYPSFAWAVILPLAGLSSFNQQDCNSSFGWAVILPSAELSSFLWLGCHPLIGGAVS